MPAPVTGFERSHILYLIALILAAIIAPFILFGGWMEEVALTWAMAAKSNGMIAGIVALLALDVLLPVPSSVVSLIAGQMLGFAAGAAVVWTGMTLGCFVGVLVGRGVLKPVARFLRVEIPEREPRSTLTQWGWTSLMLMRPVPVLAEASVLYAAVRGLSIVRIMAVTSLANIPIALLYGYAGALLLDNVPLWMMIAVLAALTAPAALWQALRRPRNTPEQRITEQ